MHNNLVQKYPEWFFTPQQMMEHYKQSTKVNKNYTPIEQLSSEQALFLVRMREQIEGNNWTPVEKLFRDHFGFELNPRDIGNKWQCVLEKAEAWLSTPKIVVESQQGPASPLTVDGGASRAQVKGPSIAASQGTSTTMPSSAEYSQSHSAVGSAGVILAHRSVTTLTAPPSIVPGPSSSSGLGAMLDANKDAFRNGPESVATPSFTSAYLSIQKERAQTNARALAPTASAAPPVAAPVEVPAPMEAARAAPLTTGGNANSDVASREEIQSRMKEIMTRRSKISTLLYGRKARSMKRAERNALTNEDKKLEQERRDLAFKLSGRSPLKGLHNRGNQQTNVRRSKKGGKAAAFRDTTLF